MIGTKVQPTKMAKLLAEFPETVRDAISPNSMKA
jgi:hypothetical protein